MFYLLDDSDGCECWYISPDRKHIEHAMKSFPSYREVSEELYRVMQQRHLDDIMRWRLITQRNPFTAEDAHHAATGE